MDERLAKEVKRLKGDEKYFTKFKTDEEVYKVLGVLEVSNTWQEFKELRERAMFRYAQFSIPEPDGYDKVLVNIFKKGKPPTTNKK
ncbi:MAG: hypothetical protein BGO31_15915 [Bacteroidetes bacterium 43-16]|mgnify:CR=1 FL=1|nr:MAG: hypothetical protein BGO31_15915 [Bacteroidetes bacterium 43-16]